MGNARSIALMATVLLAAAIIAAGILFSHRYVTVVTSGAVWRADEFNGEVIGCFGGTDAMPVCRRALPSQWVIVGEEASPTPEPSVKNSN
jgi:hypothetical protein